MRRNGEISLDENYEWTLERCLEQEKVQMVTADLLIAHLFTLGYSQMTHRMMMMLFPLFIKKYPQ
jgi:hypothetical protein